MAKAENMALQKATLSLWQTIRCRGEEDGTMCWEGALVSECCIRRGLGGSVVPVWTGRRCEDGYDDDEDECDGTFQRGPSLRQSNMVATDQAWLGHDKLSAAQL